MIRLMIVDDEEEIRKGIQNVIQWEANDILVCGEAANGKEALKLIEELSPDVLLLDIRMPVMGGIELLEMIAAKNLPVKSIILSGYDDFSYAQNAMKLGASDYLLKPCRPEEIIRTVLKVKNIIEDENKKKEAYSHLRAEFNKILPVLKEKYLAKLLYPGMKPNEKLTEIFDLYRINIRIGTVMSIIIRIDDFQIFSERNSYADIELAKFAVNNIAEELLTAIFYCEVFEFDNDIIVIINTEDVEYEKHLLPVINQIKANISKYFDFSVSVSLGKSYDDINSLHLSYAEARKAIESRFFLGDNETIRYEDIQNNFSDKSFYPAEEEKEILKCIRIGNGTELDMRIEQFFTSLNSRNLSKDHLMNAGLALALSLYHLCIELNIDICDIFGNNFSILDRLKKMDTFLNLKDTLINMIKETFTKVNSRKSSNRNLELAIKFIEKNFNKDLSLEAVANNVFITPGYLSLLFKQETGINFVEYLHKVRIEKAYELLKDTSLKTYEIAYRVGYNDEKYFSQIFRKYTGLTPTQYRDSLNAG